MKEVIIELPIGFLCVIDNCIIPSVIAFEITSNLFSNILLKGDSFVKYAFGFCIGMIFVEEFYIYSNIYSNIHSSENEREYFEKQLKLMETSLQSFDHTLLSENFEEIDRMSDDIPLINMTTVKDQLMGGSVGISIQNTCRIATGAVNLWKWPFLHLGYHKVYDDIKRVNRKFLKKFKDPHSGNDHFNWMPSMCKLFTQTEGNLYYIKLFPDCYIERDTFNVREFHCVDFPVNCIHFPYAVLDSTVIGSKGVIVEKGDSSAKLLINGIDITIDSADVSSYDYLLENEEVIIEKFSHRPDLHRYPYVTFTVKKDDSEKLGHKAKFSNQEFNIYFEVELTHLHMECCLFTYHMDGENNHCLSMVYCKALLYYLEHNVSVGLSKKLSLWWETVRKEYLSRKVDHHIHSRIIGEPIVLDYDEFKEIDDRYELNACLVNVVSVDEFEYALSTVSIDVNVPLLEKNSALDLFNLVQSLDVENVGQVGIKGKLEQYLAKIIKEKTLEEKYRLEHEKVSIGEIQFSSNPNYETPIDTPEDEETDKTFRRSVLEKLMESDPNYKVDIQVIDETIQQILPYSGENKATVEMVVNIIVSKSMIIDEGENELLIAAKQKSSDSSFLCILLQFVCNVVVSLIHACTGKIEQKVYDTVFDLIRGDKFVTNGLNQLVKDLLKDIEWETKEKDIESIHNIVKQLYTGVVKNNATDTYDDYVLITEMGKFKTCFLKKDVRNESTKINLKTNLSHLVLLNMYEETLFDISEDSLLFLLNEANMYLARLNPDIVTIQYTNSSIQYYKGKTLNKESACPSVVGQLLLLDPEQKQWIATCKEELDKKIMSLH